MMETQVGIRLAAAIDDLWTYMDVYGGYIWRIYMEHQM